MISGLVIEANTLLINRGFDYAFAGGYAIDLFLNRKSRVHGDIDICAYWDDRNAVITHMRSIGFNVYEMLGGGLAHKITDVNDQFMKKRNIFCCTADCELVTLYSTDDADIFMLDFHHIGQKKLNFIEFLFNHKTNVDFIYARNSEIKERLRDAILYNEGIPYLSPEICLLYKSTDMEREGYQSDFENATQIMNAAQLKWLDDALQTMYPDGHKWLEG